MEEAARSETAPALFRSSRSRRAPLAARVYPRILDYIRVNGCSYNTDCTDKAEIARVC